VWAGKFFEGTAASMAQVVAAVRALPPATLLWPGHEYTLTNLLFAASVEPDCASVHAKLVRVQAARRAGHSTVPSTLEEEFATNPFFRALQLLARLPVSSGAVSEAEALQAVRDAKNAFKPRPAPATPS
jgi:hydroxyacylglutathione hydrolase